jgi:hypothetical protein
LYCTLLHTTTKQITIMKLGLALVALSGTSAFAPVHGGYQRKQPTSLASAASVDSKVYTFTKSEEIFKEALEVSIYLVLYTSI